MALLVLWGQLSFVLISTQGFLVAFRSQPGCQNLLRKAVAVGELIILSLPRASARSGTMPGSCCCSIAQLCLTLCNPMDCSMPGLPVLHHLPSKLISIPLVMASNHLVLCRPLLVLPSAFLSIRVFSNESALHIRWPRYWSFSFSINPSNEYSGLILFRIDLFDLLAFQGTLKSLLQHHSSKASILWHSEKLGE